MPEGDAFAWFEVGEVAFAVAAHSVDVVATDPPADDGGADLTERLGVSPSGEEGHYLTLQSDDERGWLRVERGMLVLRANDVARHPVPNFVSDHLAAVGVSGLIEREGRLAYVVSAKRLLRGTAVG